MVFLFFIQWKGAGQGPKPRKSGGPKGGSPKGRGPEKVGARKGGGPKFRAFFSPLPPHKSFFSSLSLGSSR